MILHNTQSRSPLTSFRNPVAKDRQWTDNKEGRRLWSFGLFHRLEERESLHGLSETHFIAEDTADTIVSKIQKERKTFELVWLQLCKNPGQSESATLPIWDILSYPLG